MPITVKKAERIQKLPPYLFAEIDRLKREVAARGVDLVNLGIGDPDMPTPPHVIARLCEAARNPANHRYPDYEGLPAFRRAAAAWMRSRYGVTLDPETEVVSLIGSKEGIANLAVAFVDPDDVVLVPDPGYPVYHIGTQFNGGTTYRMPLRRENGFLPDLGAIPTEVARRAKLLWLNYPNNPTGTVAPRSFFADAIRFAERHGIVIGHDAAYAELYYGERPPSILEMPGGRDVAIEFHSLSKTFNMTGWRVGFAVGNAELVAGLGKVKTNVDSGVFQAVQEAAIAALESEPSVVANLRATYRERRDVLVAGLATAGLPCEPPAGTFYVWVPVPRGQSSAALAKRCLTEAGVVVTPGNGFGDAGEGYVRLTLCSPVARLREAVERLRALRL
ncbi:MAG TPA: LL-diaminopimelate aminotransferase [Candidatus Binatia bacterium]|nr:LL-diaminopimelate aminotransferase [Candidatus Binatia bacterium]